MQVPVIEAGRLEHEVGLQAGTAVACHLHSSELLDPQLAHDHIVDAAVHVTPSVGFTPPERQIKNLKVIILNLNIFIVFCIVFVESIKHSSKFISII